MIRIYGSSSNSVYLDYELSIERDNSGTSAIVTATGTLYGNGSSSSADSSGRGLFIHLRQDVLPRNTTSKSAEVQSAGVPLGEIQSVITNGIQRDGNTFMPGNLNKDTIPKTGVPFTATWMISNISSQSITYEGCSIFLSANSEDPLKIYNNNYAYKFVGKEYGGISDNLRYVTEDLSVPVGYVITLNNITTTKKSYNSIEYNYSLNLQSSDYSKTGFNDSDLKIRFYNGSTKIADGISFNKNLILGNYLPWSNTTYKMSLYGNAGSIEIESEKRDIQYYNNTNSYSLTSDITNKFYKEISISNAMIDTGAQISFSTNPTISGITLSNGKLLIPDLDPTFFNKVVQFTLSVTNGAQNTKTIKKSFTYISNPFYNDNKWDTVVFSTPSAEIKPYTGGSIQLSAKINNVSQNIALKYGNNYYGITSPFNPAPASFNYNTRLGINDYKGKYAINLVVYKQQDGITFYHPNASATLSFNFSEPLVVNTISKNSVFKEGQTVAITTLQNAYNGYSFTQNLYYGFYSTGPWYLIGSKNDKFSSDTSISQQSKTLNYNFYCGEIKNSTIYIRTETITTTQDAIIQDKTTPFSGSDVVKFVPVSAQYRSPSSISSGMHIEINFTTIDTGGAESNNYYAYAQLSDGSTSAPQYFSGTGNKVYSFDYTGAGSAYISANLILVSSNQGITKTSALGQISNIPLDYPTVCPRKNAIGINGAPTSEDQVLYILGFGDKKVVKYQNCNIVFDTVNLTINGGTWDS